MNDRVLTVAIATPLELELVARIQAADSQLEVRYEPDLLPPPRYPGDHHGQRDFRRSEVAQGRWQELLLSAEILFGVPGEHPAALADVVRRSERLRWVQAMAAGAGQQLRAAELTTEELERVQFTSSSGVHAGPLAEFALFGLLAFARGLPRLQADQRERRWGHYPVGELCDRTLLIVGLGRIGEEVARLARAFGMHTLGVSRSGRPRPHVDTIHPPGELGELLPRCDAIVISLPLTEETEGLLDRAMLERCRPGAVLVNIGRGGVIDEAALVEALRSGHLAGAALDVFATEPLPDDSPLWDLPNVIVSPHTAALSVRENERIVDLFLENLRCFRRGQPMPTRIDPQRYY